MKNDDFETVKSAEATQSVLSRTGSLTASQLKVLLLLASTQAHGTAASQRVSGAIQRVLLLCRRLGRPSEELFERAAERETSVNDLIRIKERAKELVSAAADSEDREAAGLLYNVVVAAALSHHGVDISSSSLETRQELYGRLAQSFDGHAIGDIFLHASNAAVSQKRRRSS